MSVADRVRELIEPKLAAQQTEVIDIELGHGLLRVTVDRPNGIDLEAVTEISEQISEILDDADPISEQYTLEVSSPGIERPLRTPEHFARFVGSQIQLKSGSPVDGQRRFSGVLESADSNGIVLDGHQISYEEIQSARLVADWDAEFAHAEASSSSATEDSKGH